MVPVMGKSVGSRGAGDITARAPSVQDAIGGRREGGDDR